MTRGVDPANPSPIFRQIADGLRDAVAAGVYRPGELVPSVRQQALLLLVNPNTVQKAYDELERDGVLVAKRGVGMAVANGSRHAAAKDAAEDVKAAIATAIERAAAAGLAKATIDRIYDEAWRNVTKRRST